MNEYYFELAGLQVVLRTQEPILVADRLRPFLRDKKEKTHCAICVQEASLPPASKNVIWNGHNGYDRREDGLYLFHCDRKGQAPFAVTCYRQDNRVDVLVKPGAMDHFAGTTSVINRLGLENWLLEQGCLLLHGAVINYNNVGIVFSGPSGVGKSTQGALWEKHRNAQVINGDRVILKMTEEGCFGYGSPYAGSSGIYRNESVLLQAVVVLEQAQENVLQRLTAKEALTRLYPEVSGLRFDKQAVEQITDCLLAMLRHVPVYLFRCVPEESAVSCLEKGLNL